MSEEKRRRDGQAAKELLTRHARDLTNARTTIVHFVEVYHALPDGERPESFRHWAVQAFGDGIIDILDQIRHEVVGLVLETWPIQRDEVSLKETLSDEVKRLKFARRRMEKIVREYEKLPKSRRPDTFRLWAEMVGGKGTDLIMDRIVSEVTKVSMAASPFYDAEQPETIMDNEPPPII